MRIGLNADPAELSGVLAGYPGISFTRVFGPPNTGIPGWNRTAVAKLRKAGVTPWISFKDWKSDSAAVASLNSWLTAMPADQPEVFLTYHHEPQGDLDPNEYRRRWVLLAAVVRAHRNSPRVKLVPIDVLYPSRHKMWDRYNTDWTKWTGIWQQWAPTDRNGRYVGDYVGWDCYLESGATAYDKPEVFFRHPVSAAHALGVPLVIPELGALRVPADPTGTGRAAWIRDCLTYLRATATVGVAWWHDTGTNGKDYRLSDTYSAQAWRSAITTSG